MEPNNLLQELFVQFEINKMALNEKRFTIIKGESKQNIVRNKIVKKKTIYYDRVRYGQIWMCQCVIYRVTCFLWRLSWPHKKQSGASLRDAGLLKSEARTLQTSLRAYQKWEKQAIATSPRRADDTSHVAVIFTMFPFYYAFCDRFDVWPAFAYCALRGNNSYFESLFLKYCPYKISFSFYCSFFQ